MNNSNLSKLTFGIFLFLMVISCDQNSEGNLDSVISDNELMIRQIHADYVEGWKNMDERKVMDLLEEESQIQPNRFNPVVGKENIRAFWFPRDSSETIINEFTTEIISLTLLDTIALTTHSSVLDWDYKKDSTNFGMNQKGINTTIYRKQKDGSWKIWRSMWSDLYSKSK